MLFLRNPLRQRHFLRIDATSTISIAVNFLLSVQAKYVVGVASRYVKGWSRCCRMDGRLTFYMPILAPFCVNVTS
jgi:hypothetical protein